MKSFLTCAGALIAAAGLIFAQSPDATETKVIAGNTMTINYASPPVGKDAGKLFTKDGRIVKEDTAYPIWRAGDGPATMFHTEADLDLGGLAVPGEKSGTEQGGWYTLYVDLTDPDHWTLIVNKELHQWGLTYNQPQDLGRVKMTMGKPPAMVENLKYTLTDLGGNKGRLTLAWENYSASVDFTVK
jgi:hypothetical protein